MQGKWIGILIAAVMLNGFALLASSKPYTAWGIRVRNQALYAITRSERYRNRAENAGAIAEGVVRWLRPLMLVAVNLFLLFLLYRTARTR